MIYHNDWRNAKPAAMPGPMLTSGENEPELQGFRFKVCMCYIYCSLNVML